MFRLQGQPVGMAWHFLAQFPASVVMALRLTLRYRWRPGILSAFLLEAMRSMVAVLVAWALALERSLETGAVLPTSELEAIRSRIALW